MFSCLIYINIKQYEFKINVGKWGWGGGFGEFNIGKLLFLHIVLGDKIPIMDGYSVVYFWGSICLN